MNIFSSMTQFETLLSKRIIPTIALTGVLIYRYALTDSSGKTRLCSYIFSPDFTRSNTSALKLNNIVLILLNHIHSVKSNYQIYILSTQPTPMFILSTQPYLKISLDQFSQAQKESLEQTCQIYPKLSKSFISRLFAVLISVLFV